MDKNTLLLEQILTAQVLILSRMLKAEKKARGVTGTSDFTAEASKLIQKRQSQILRLLQ